MAKIRAQSADSAGSRSPCPGPDAGPPVSPRRPWWRAAITVAMLTGTIGTALAQDFETARRRLLGEIRADVELTSRQIGRKTLDPRVMQAIGRVPRHEFVPAELRARAYVNRPLPIGYGQTISQPYIVALMTDLLSLEPGQSVLEVGTGSGYQAAVLAEMQVKVRSIEIIPELGEQAAERLQRLGYATLETRIGDGYFGWQESAPFDAIMVTAAATHIPPPLVQQLKQGGIMVIPVGGPYTVQQLTLVEKSASGKIETRQVLPVAFVPLTGGHRTP